MEQRKTTAFRHAEHMADTIGRTLRPYAEQHDLEPDLVLDSLTMAAVALCECFEDGQQLFAEWVATLLEFEELQILPCEESSE